MSFFANNFLICPGVEKCGTTSLHAFLQNRPGIILPDLKETFFFNSYFDQGEDKYKSLFPSPFEGSAHPDEQTEPSDPLWYGDITPSYFRREKTRNHIKNSLTGEVAIVFLIRNPVKRAFSFYWHDLVRHITRGEKAANKFEAFRNFSFDHFLAMQDQYFLTPYAPTLSAWMNAFPNAVKVHLIEEVIQQPDLLVDTINTLTGLTLEKGRPYPRENEAMTASLSIFPKGIRRHTPSGVKIIELKRQHAINAMAMQGTFSHFLPKERCEEIFHSFFEQDTKRCEDILGRSLDIFRKQTDLISPIMKTQLPKV